MATRALVGYMSPNGSVDVIYVHNGSLRDCGDVLKKYYTNRNKVFDLIMLGDASQINKNIEPTGEHSFANKEPDVCVFYGRDRGDSGCDSEHWDSVDELMDVYEERLDIEYIYIFDAKSNKWITYDMNNNGQIIECETRKSESLNRRSRKLAEAGYTDRFEYSSIADVALDVLARIQKACDLLEDTEGFTETDSEYIHRAFDLLEIAYRDQKDLCDELENYA